MPVEECKRAFSAAPIFDEALYRRCAGGDEGGEDDELDDGSWDDDDDDDGDADNTQQTSSSPRQDCILTQMELFPMPNFGLCESLPDAPPTPNPAPPVTPIPAPVVPAPAPAPARKPLPVDADGPARAIPKREIEPHILRRVLARSPDDDIARDLARPSSDSRSSADINRRCGGSGGGDGGGGDGGGGGGGEGFGGDSGEGYVSDTGSEGGSEGEGEFSDLDSEQLADLDPPDKWNNYWFCYAWILLSGSLPDVGCDMFRIQSSPPNSGSLPPARPAPPPSAPSPHKATGGDTGGRVPLMRRRGP